MYFPVFLDLRGRRCTVVGGGAVAERKVEALLEAGGQVRVVAPELTASLDGLGAEGRIRVERRRYCRGDLRGAWLAIAATGDPATNEAVWREAQALGILINTVDDPEHCTFIVPALVRRGDLTIAVSTGGKSPALAKQIRREIEEIYPSATAQHLEAIARLRARVRVAIERPAAREAAWREIMERGLVDRLRAGDQPGAMALVEAVIARSR